MLRWPHFSCGYGRTFIFYFFAPRFSPSPPPTRLLSCRSMHAACDPHRAARCGALIGALWALLRPKFGHRGQHAAKPRRFAGPAMSYGLFFLAAIVCRVLSGACNPILHSIHALRPSRCQAPAPRSLTGSSAGSASFDTSPRPGRGARGARTPGRQGGAPEFSGSGSAPTPESPMEATGLHLSKCSDRPTALFPILIRCREGPRLPSTPGSSCSSSCSRARLRSAQSTIRPRTASPAKPDTTSPPGYGNFDIGVGQVSCISQYQHPATPPHAMRCALLRAHSHRMLVCWCLLNMGAFNPMLRPIRTPFPFQPAFCTRSAGRTAAPMQSMQRRRSSKSRCPACSPSSSPQSNHSRRVAGHFTQSLPCPVPLILYILLDFKFYLEFSCNIPKAHMLVTGAS